MCILSDGWTDVNGTALINIILTTPKPIFYKAIDPETEQHSGDYIFKILDDCIQDIGRSKILAVCTDNAANMKSAWRKIQEKYPEILTYGCVAHSLNLMAKDVLNLPTFSKVYTQAKKIIQFFRNKHLPRQVLRRIQLEKNGSEISLAAPSDTRWCAAAFSFESILKNKEYLQQAVLDSMLRNSVDPLVRRCVLDEDVFWPRLETTFQILKPISCSISEIESDTNSIVKVTPGIKNLESSAEVYLKELNLETGREVRKIIEVRKKFLHHSAHLAAYLLHPKYRGEGCTESEIEEAIEFIVKFSCDRNFDEAIILQELAEYKAKMGFFEKKYLWRAAESTEPAIWWTAFCDSINLSTIATKILSLPASAASCERNWKVFSNTKTKKRNRLKVEKTEKLVSIKFNLELLKDDDFKHIDESDESPSHNASVDEYDETGFMDNVDDNEIDLQFTEDTDEQEFECSSSSSEDDGMEVESEQFQVSLHEERGLGENSHILISDGENSQDWEKENSVYVDWGEKENSDQDWERKDCDKKNTDVHESHKTEPQKIIILPEGKKFFILNSDLSKKNLDT